MTTSTAAPSKIYKKYHRRVQGLHVESAKSVNILRRGCGEQQASSLPDLEQDIRDWQQELADSRLIFLGQTGLGKTTTLEILLILTTQVGCNNCYSFLPARGPLYIYSSCRSRLCPRLWATLHPALLRK